MGIWRYTDNPGFLWGFDEWEEQVGKIEMAEMIDSHGHLYSHLVQLPVIHHHSCIVDQNIDMIELFANIFSKLLHWAFLGEV